MSALSAGFEMLLLGPGIRGVKPDETEKAIVEMREGGAMIVPEEEEGWEEVVRVYVGAK